MVEEDNFAEGTTRSHEIEYEDLKQIGWWNTKFKTFHTRDVGKEGIPVYIRIQDDRS